MPASGTAEELRVSFLQHIPDGVYWKDRRSRFVRISRSLAARFGLNDPSQAINKTDFDMFSEVHARQAFEDERQTVRSGQPIVEKEKGRLGPTVATPNCSSPSCLCATVKETSSAPWESPVISPRDRAPVCLTYRRKGPNTSHSSNFSAPPTLPY